MSEIATLAVRIIEARRGNPSLSNEQFNELLLDFRRHLDVVDQAMPILEVIEVDSSSWLLPFELIEDVFRQAVKLGVDDTDVLRWYASRLMFYGDSSDEQKARSLLQSRGINLPS